MERKKTNEGYKFLISEDGNLQINKALFKKFEMDYKMITSVKLEEDSDKIIRNYVDELKKTHKKIFTEKNIKIKPQVLVGVLPAGRMEMYQDIDVTEYMESELIKEIFSDKKTKDDVNVIEHGPEDHEKYLEQDGLYTAT